MPEQQFDKSISPETPVQKPLEKEQIDTGVEVEKEPVNIEKEADSIEKQVQSSSATPISTTATPIPTAPAAVKTETRKKIEGILSEDLKEIFQGLPRSTRVLAPHIQPPETERAI